MPATASRFTPYVQELLDNEYAQENLLNGATKLRAAYGRSKKRRVNAARDRKLRRQLTVAALSLGEGAKALAGGRRKPPKRRGRRLVMFLGIGALGTGVALAVNEDPRSSLFGSALHSEPTSEGS
ncbi:MAG TPA: hypothetical protein VGN84_07415 [Solirubrobacterales bacterium]|jgi:hypothetical protein|nr:hypothetical protein [Solirubrobacterales bacterium]